MTKAPRARAHTLLGAGREFDVIRRMLDRWGDVADSIGDDAAIVQPWPGQLVVSTDASVEDVHFRREWLTHTEIGYRASAAALSDLAAMAAEPIGVFLALTLPESDVLRADEIADGIGECLRASRARMLGGDVTRGNKLSLVLTVLGSANRPLLRSGARAGDRVSVTGRLGGPLAALRDFRAGATPSPANRRRFARPVPRLREAIWLADRGASAAIDLSDGLASDAEHLAAASGVQLRLHAERVPLIPGSTVDAALVSGEEYELLITSPDEIDAVAFRDEFDLDLTEIGRVTEGTEPGVIITNDGRPVITPAGYDHFAD